MFNSIGDGDRLFNVTVMSRGFCHIGRTSANCDDYDGEGNGSWARANIREANGRGRADAGRDFYGRS